MAKTIKEYRYELCSRINDMQSELSGYDGYITDAIQEIADNHIGIYYHEQDEFAIAHPDYMSRALSEGIVMSGYEYFNAYPNNDYKDYTRHVAIAAWYEFNYDEICGYLDNSSLDDAILYAILDDFDGDEIITDEQIDELEKLSLDCQLFEDAFDIIAEII